MLELLTLFLSAFLAATIFPAQSEILLSAMIIANKSNYILLLLTATLGNVLGSIVNWLMGIYVVRFKDKRYFPLSDKKMQKYSNLYRKWVKSSLLLAWLPIIGDPLTIVAGIFRTNIWQFILLVTIGKLARYIFVAFVSLQV